MGETLVPPGSNRELAREVKNFFKEAIDTDGVSCGLVLGEDKLYAVRIDIDPSVDSETATKLKEFCESEKFGVVVKVVSLERPLAQDETEDKA